MPRPAQIRRLLPLGLLLLAGSAWAGDQCPMLSQRQSDPMVATRIAAIACDEHLRWNRPFIDADGRLASATTYEAEASGLADGSSPWRRVAYYWQTSGLLRSVAGRPGASGCGDSTGNGAPSGMGCRGFVVDTPWSAAFVSWVAERAGVPAFTASASHFDYVRAARSNPARSPYTYADPRTTRLQTGDMLCYVRTGRIFGYDGLAASIDRGAAGLPMHCDFVVATDGGHAYTIGGNVQQAVTMRILNLNSEGLPWALPERSTDGIACAPDQEAGCNFNRQDWAVVLKLKPQDELARLGSVAPRFPGQQPSAPAAAPQCCVDCVVGAGVPRCPAPGATPPPQVPAASDPIQGSE